MRSKADRLRHAIGYEVFGLLLCAPLAGAVLDAPLLDVGGLTLVLSLVAGGWNMVYHALTDRLALHCRGHLRKSWADRVGLAIGFEIGLSLFSIPIVFVWLSVSLWEAFLADLGFMLFYCVYAFFYTLFYDWLFPLPEPTSQPLDGSSAGS